jgi:hypothetical protein
MRRRRVSALMLKTDVLAIVSWMFLLAMGRPE